MRPWGDGLLDSGRYWNGLEAEAARESTEYQRSAYTEARECPEGATTG